MLRYNLSHGNYPGNKRSILRSESRHPFISFPVVFARKFFDCELNALIIYRIRSNVYDDFTFLLSRVMRDSLGRSIHHGLVGQWKSDLSVLNFISTFGNIRGLDIWQLLHSMGFVWLINVRYGIWLNWNRHGGGLIILFIALGEIWLMVFCRWNFAAKRIYKVERTM